MVEQVQELQNELDDSRKTVTRLEIQLKKLHVENKVALDQTMSLYEQQLQEK